MPPRLQQLLLSLQLIELIVTHNEMALYKAYKKQLERVFTLLKSPSDNFPELQNVQNLWVQESEYARQRNVDKIHLYTHTLAPHCRFPDILGLMQQTSGAYIGVNSGLFFALNKNELFQYQSDRNLVNVIMRVLNLYSTLVPLPAPQTPWNPGEWSLYMNIVPDAPEAPSYSIHTNVEVSDKRDLARQITSSFLTRRFNPPSPPILKIRSTTRNQLLTSEFLEAHRDSLTPPAPWNYVGQNLQSQNTSPMEDQLRAIFKAKARSVYVAPQTLSNSLFPNMSWAA